ncbi:hypothetical protein O181_130284 [Austropuccinia psidii MF-1]|uniref:Uncharacterized protein n=1 Tax=Austropuccinia psidii MF-1 TaxID=1389203 RepID=A0A9Q3Q9Y1_9BASI|nr:hypothetical protein [Austropuccinia psidii MF-1]
MIQTSKDMVRIFCDYGLELKECDEFTHYWFTILLALELEYKTSIHTSTNKTPSILEKGWNPRQTQNSLRKNLVIIHPTAASFKQVLGKARKNSVRCMQDSFPYSKEKWDKANSTPDLRMGYLIFVSTTNFNKMEICKDLKQSFTGTFVIKALHEEDGVEVGLSEELGNKNPTFPVSLINPCRCGDSERFPLRNKVSQDIAPVGSSGTKKITKVLKEGKLRTKKVR